MMIAQEKLLTADDLWELSHSADNIDKRFELIQGVLCEMSPAGWLHGDITSEIGALIRNHVKANKLGRVTAAETGFILAQDPYTVRAPDVGFIRQERAPQQLPQKYVPLAPDLAVEVISPNDTASEIHRRTLDYLNAGTQIVWIIYPESKTVDVRSSAGAQILSAQDLLDGGDVLPGFSLRVGDLFSQ